MAVEAAGAGVDLTPTSPLPPGPLLTIAADGIELDVAAAAGGRIAQIRCDGVDQLLAWGAHGATAAIAWGCYPMVPWCGRIRDGRFAFGGERHQLPVNLGPHAIHGVGFLMPWQVTGQGECHVELELALPRDHRWPFGGVARQRFELGERQLRLGLAVTADGHAMPASIGWHPWFLKPDRLEFTPDAMYPRDAEGIALLPPGPVRPGPWDDCFVNRRDVLLHRAGQRLRVSSACSDWVVYDGTEAATCVEPQTAPPDAFNLQPDAMLRPGETLAAHCVLRWE